MKSNSFLVRVAMTVFIVFSLVMIVKLQIRFNELKDQKEDLRVSIDEYEQSIAELRYKLELPFDDEYVTKVARDKLNYHLPEEIIFYNDLYR